MNVNEKNPYVSPSNIYYEPTSEVGASGRYYVLLKFNVIPRKIVMLL